ncbi:MAG: Fic family protein [Glaciihabitans sp.]|nr:Fic family protein [Glaciihabitans sp.]
MSEDSPEPRIIPYEPFPSFKEWSGTTFDSNVFDGFAELLDQTKATATADQLLNAVQTATRWAAVDTGAIEGMYEVDRGFTFSVAAGVAAWENIHQVKGEDAELAINDNLAGYEFVLDVATRSAPISENLIKELHSTLCASQNTYNVLTPTGWQERELIKGKYKDDANNPFNIAQDAIHSYASPVETPAEMGRLIVELRSEAFAAAHPVVQAAYAHYAFVCIHPFSDGNGRVSRALASAFLYRRPGVPLVIFADQKGDYLDALENADAGEAGPFVQFVSECAIDTIQMVRTNVSRPVRKSIKEQLATFAPVLTGRGGLPHQEIDVIGTRVMQTLASEIDAVLLENPLAPPFSSERGSTNMPFKAPEGYRVVPGTQKVTMNVKVAHPGPASVSAQFSVGISLPETEGPDFIVYSANGVIDLEILLREVHPTVGRAYTYRLHTLLEDTLADLVQDAAARSKRALIEAGYYPDDEPHE